MRVHLEGIWLVDLSIHFPKGPIVHHARVGDWMTKEELAASLFVIPKLWRRSSVACGSLMQIALVPSTPLGCRQLLVSIYRVVYLVLHYNVNVFYNEYSMWINNIIFYIMLSFFPSFAFQARYLLSWALNKSPENLIRKIRICELIKINLSNSRNKHIHSEFKDVL